MEFILYFTQVSLYPVAAIVICGFFNWLCGRVFLRLLGRSGYNMLVASAFVGTPIHELGHAAMCLLFRHEIVELVLWQPHSDDGTWGYVRHTHNTDDLYQKLGNLFISAGPIFSGMAVLSLLLMIFFPDTWRSHISAVVSLVEGDASVLAGIFSGLRMIPNMLAELTRGPAALGRILVVLVMLSVSLRMSLSPQDIECAVHALPSYLTATLVLTVIVTVLGRSLSAAVVGALEAFSVFLMAMFSLVLAFSVVQILLALVIHWVRSLLDR